MKTSELSVGDALPDRQHTPTNVSLFLYNAAVWNAHRIHYDEPYTTDIEKHPGVVIDGPLQGDWLTQCVMNWLGDAGELEEFHYSNRKATHLGDTLTSGGQISEIDLDANRVVVELWIKDAEGNVVTPGGATVRLKD